VLDPNVWVSALLSPRGTPASIVRRWLEGESEIIVSPLLVEELARVLAYPKLRSRIGREEAAQFLTLLREAAEMRADPEGGPPVRPSDRNDEYLVSLASAAEAVIVTGDSSLLALAGRVPVYSPAGFLELIARHGR